MCDEKLGTFISRIAIIDNRQVDEIYIMITVLLFNVAHVIILVVTSLGCSLSPCIVIDNMKVTLYNNE